MKLNDLPKNFYCFKCNKKFIESDACPYCQSTDIKHIGYVCKEIASHSWSEQLPDLRRQHRKELLQPYRQGEFSKEYKDAYPEQAKQMVKDKVITKKQYDKAKNVWGRDDLR